MGKDIKVGDWVRVVANDWDFDDVKVGGVYKVEHVDKTGNVYINGLHTMWSREIEPWTPKVGERVRFTDECHAAWWFGPSTGIKRGVVVSDKPAGSYSYSVKTTDGIGYVNLRHIEPVIDEPASAAPAKPSVSATVDAISDEYGNGARPVAEQPAAKFKVGDRVVAISDNQKGHTGTLRFIDTDGTFLVEFDTWRRGHDGSLSGSSYGEKSCWWLLEHDMQLVVETRATAIVCLMRGNQPLPADKPHVHATIESAEAEAKRLAGVHRGDKFAVFVQHGEPVGEAKVYEHEWQRLAADGKVIRAIQSLRRTSGIGQKTAADAVMHFRALARAA